VRRSVVSYAAFIGLIALLWTLAACAGRAATAPGAGQPPALPTASADRVSDVNLVAVIDSRSFDLLLRQDRPVVLALLDSGNT
jgi:hypothetical protein